MFREDIYYELIVISTLVNRTSFTKTIVNTNYLYYRLYDLIYTMKANLTRIIVKPFYIEGFDREKAMRPVQEVVITDLDIEGFTDRV